MKELNCAATEPGNELAEQSNVHTLMNSIPGMVWSVDKDLKLVLSNLAFDNLVEQFSGGRICRGQSVLGKYFGVERNERFRKYYERAMAGESFSVEEFADPVERFYELHFEPIRMKYDIIGTACCAHDITHIKNAEKKLVQSNRLYSFVNEINGAIMQSDSEAKLFEAICRIAIETGEFDLSVISRIDECRHRSYMVAHCNADEEDIALFTALNYDDNGPTQYVISKGLKHVISCVTCEPQGCRWKEYAESKGFLSQIYLPLEKNGNIEYILMIYSTKETSLDQAEVMLLENSAAQISFALNVMEKEKRRREAELKLQQKKKRFAMAQQMVHLGNWEMDLATGIVTWSEELCRICGLEPEENIQSLDSWLSFVHPEDRADVLIKLKTGEESLSCYSFYHRLVRRDGTVRLAFCQNCYELDENGNAVSLYGACHDVTELKDAENKLLHIDFRLKQAQEAAHIGSWEMNLATGVLLWSEEHCRIFGIPVYQNRQTLSSWLSFVHPEDRNTVYRAVSENAYGKVCTFSYRIILTDGTVKHINGRANFEVDPEGRPILIYGTAHDVTEIKDAQDKLLIANRLYSFTSHINQAIVHEHDEQSLFDKACEIAVKVGKFEMAWIGKIDRAAQTLSLVAEANASEADKNLLSCFVYGKNGPAEYVSTHNTYHIIDDFDKAELSERIRNFGSCRGYRSGIMLPISKGGEVTYTLSLYSRTPNFFNDDEIALLREVAEDLSYSLEVFEKEKLRTETEKKLQHSELRLKQAQKTAHFGSWELDFSTGVAIWSDEACRIYGLPVSENRQSYDAWLSFLHPDDLEYILNTIKQTQKDLSNSAFFHRIIRRDGTVRHLYSMTNFELQDGKPVGLYGVTHDITDISEAQAALTQSTSNLNMMVDMLPQAIFAKDYNGKFVFVNQSFANLYGLTPQQVVGKTIAETIPTHNEPAHFLQQDREVMDSGQTKVIPELRFTDSHGEARVFFTTKVPFTVPGKNEKAILGIATDVTEQKKSEEERAQMMADIVQRNKDLEQFSYIVSHNLRAPVANIIGISDLLQSGTRNKTDDVILMQGLATSVQKLDGVIKDLNYILQVKRQVTEKRQIVNLSQLVWDIQLSINNMIEENDVLITTNFAEADTLHSIKSYVYSIFYNLISNSIKYRRPGIKPVIEITSKLNGKSIEVQFKDNGLGIDTERYKAYLFGLYKRFHNEAEGKGIGLFMVKSQVETLGGKISLQSEVNKGSIFTITFEQHP